MICPHGAEQDICIHCVERSVVVDTEGCKPADKVYISRRDNPETPHKSTVAWDSLTSMWHELMKHQIPNFSFIKEMYEKDFYPTPREKEDPEDMLIWLLEKVSCLLAPRYINGRFNTEGVGHARWDQWLRWQFGDERTEEFMEFLEGLGIDFNKRTFKLSNELDSLPDVPEPTPNPLKQLWGIDIEAPRVYGRPPITGKMPSPPIIAVGQGIGGGYSHHPPDPKVYDDDEHPAFEEWFRLHDQEHFTAQNYEYAKRNHPGIRLTPLLIRNRYPDFWYVNLEKAWREYLVKLNQGVQGNWGPPPTNEKCSATPKCSFDDVRCPLCKNKNCPSAEKCWSCGSSWEEDQWLT